MIEFILIRNPNEILRVKLSKLGFHFQNFIPYKKQPFRAIIYKKKVPFFYFLLQKSTSIFFWSSWRGPPKHSDLHFLDLTPWPMGKGVLRPLHPSRRLLIHSIEWPNKQDILKTPTRDQAPGSPCIISRSGACSHHCCGGKRGALKGISRPSREGKGSSLSTNLPSAAACSSPLFGVSLLPTLTSRDPS